MAGTEMIANILLLLLAYIYVGYPAMMWLVSKLFPRRHKVDPSHEPSVTLVISAYNEDAVISAKIENSLKLDYPAGKLSIMVVSDCSSDGTDEKVRSFAERGVQLVTAAERRGKTAALNTAVESITTDIVVFSDANAMYDNNAIRRLVSHFGDGAVGYVVGHSRYQEETKTAAGVSEEAYWDLEVLIKEWESRAGSVVGGDGAIYAIRRSLYEPMQETDINDFVNPLQIVTKGYRGVFDRDAWCVENPAGDFEKEFSRKVRIANRSFNAVLRVPQTLNPFKVGMFSWQLLSHKVLRWFSPFLLLALFGDLLVYRASEEVHAMDEVIAAAGCVFVMLAVIGWCLRRRKMPPLFSLPYYFILMNLASAAGVFLRMRGKTISTWTTVRQDETETRRSPVVQRLLLIVVFLSLPLGLCVAVWGKGSAVVALTLVGLLAYAYLGYPLVLALVGTVARKEIARDEGYLPTMTLLIVAYNEELEIDKKLQNTLLLDYPRELLQVIVASDGSSDATNAIVSRYGDQGIKLLAFPKNRGKIAALNDAMKVISTEIVVLSDANVAYEKAALKKLVRNFSDARVGAVSGKVILVNDSLSYGKAESGYYSIEHFIQEQEGALGVLAGADGAMYAIRRFLFKPPPLDTILDDLVISMSVSRAGYLVIHEKEAVGYEVNRTEVAGEFRRKARIIAGGYQCLLRGALLPSITHPLLMFSFFSHKVLRWISGFLILALLGVLLRLHFQQGEATPFFTTVLALLVAAMLVAFVVQLFPRFKSYRLSNYSHYFFMLMFASLVGCYLGVTGRQKVAWRGGSS